MGLGGMNMTTEKPTETIEEAWERLVSEYNTDVFMEPFGDECDYVEVEVPDGDSYISLMEFFDINEMENDTVITVRNGYLAWTSAPGYMDRTDYSPISDVSDLESWFEDNFEIKEEVTE